MNRTKQGNEIVALPSSKLNAWMATLFSRLGKVGTAAFLISIVVILIVLAVTMLAPLLLENDPMQQNLSDRYQPPGPEYLMGTDHLGRDIFIRVIYGARTSLGIAVVTGLLSLLVGGIIGFSAGYLGGTFDTVIVRINDILMAFPTVLLAIAIITFIGGGIFNLVLAISFASLPGFFRIARSIAMSIRNMEFVTASISFGSTHWWQITRHVLPNGVPLMLVLLSARLGEIILAESSLSFLGLGIPPGTPSWGAMISTGRIVLREAPWVSLVPGVAMMIVIIGFNQIGDALRDLLDPRMRGAGIER